MKIGELVLYSCLFAVLYHRGKGEEREGKMRREEKGNMEGGREGGNLMPE